MAPDLVSTSAPAPRQMVSGSYKIPLAERYPVECTKVSVPSVEYSASPIDLVPVKDTHVQCVLRISQIQENTGKYPVQPLGTSVFLGKPLRESDSLLADLLKSANQSSSHNF